MARRDHESPAADERAPGIVFAPPGSVVPETLCRPPTVSAESFVVMLSASMSRIHHNVSEFASTFPI
jgi:hypothetical protein